MAMAETVLSCQMFSESAHQRDQADITEQRLENESVSRNAGSVGMTTGTSAFPGHPGARRERK